MYALRLKPLGYYLLDDTASFQDYSGYNRGSNFGGTEAHGISLVSGAKYSQRFGGGTYGAFTVPVYVKGKESSPFSLTAVVFPILTGGSQNTQILSRTDDFDGLWMNGTKINFTTMYTNTGSATATYDMGVVKKADVVGVHTNAKNSLYVDGVLVAEVDITAEQQADSYKTSSNLFASGYLTSTQKLLINGIGFYGRALQTEEVQSLYSYNNARAEGTVARIYGGDEVLLGNSVRQAYIDTGWYTDADWQAASLINTAVDDGQITAMMSNELTIASEWLDSVDLYNGETASPINSIVLWWEGVNETIEASVDAGVTWVPVVKGRPLTNVPAGFDPTGKALTVRITFPAGQSEAYVDNLSVRGYLTNTATSAGRTVTYTNAVPFNDDSPALMRDNLGVKIGTGGSVVIGPDQTSPVQPVRTIEVWVKPDVAWTATMGTASTTAYQNGGNGPNNSAIPAGEWVVAHRILSADHSGNITLDVVGTVGKIVVYPTALTLAQIADLYANYTGINKLRYDGTGFVNIVEPTEPVEIYGYDWEIAAA